MNNWANSYTYRAARIEEPQTIDEVAAIVAREPRVRALGSRHSFNAIADREGGVLVSTQHLDRVIGIDVAQRQATIESGITYAKLGPLLQDAGLALANYASLPHITIAGAAATATHGSGETLACLSTHVGAIEFVVADGSSRWVRRGEADFEGVVVHLGRLGVVTRLIIDCVPAFDVSQVVYDNVPAVAYFEHLDAIAASTYSVSGFLNRYGETIHQVWVKSLANVPHFDFVSLGGTRADTARHPISGRDDVIASEGAGAAATTQQLGEPGPSHERLPHFRAKFVASSGEELQSEFFVPREHATAAFAALRSVADVIDPLLQVSEIRLIARDALWLSPFYERDTVAFHFTWKLDKRGVHAALPTIEAALRPFDVRVHPGKLSTIAQAVEKRYVKKAAFEALRSRWDPTGKFGEQVMGYV